MRNVSVFLTSLLLTACSSAPESNLTELSLRNGEHNINSRVRNYPKKELYKKMLPPAPAYIKVWIHERVLSDGTAFQGGEAYVPFFKPSWESE